MVLGKDIFGYSPVAGRSGEFYLTSLVDRFAKDHQVHPIMSLSFRGDITMPADLDRIEKML